MTDTPDCFARYRQIAADLRRQIASELPSDEHVPYAAFLVVVRGTDQRTVMEGLRALRDAESTEEP